MSTGTGTGTPVSAEAPNVISGAVPPHDGRDLDDLELAERDELLETLEREVGVLMRRARRVIALRASLVHPDLMPTSYLVLGHVSERGSVRASAVAELFDLDKGAVSRHVQHLVELGLVERSPDPEDRRATLLAPTDEARERMRRVVQVRRARLRRRLGEWDDDGITTFVDLLHRYNRALDDIEHETEYDTEHDTEHDGDDT